MADAVRDGRDLMENDGMGPRLSVPRFRFGFEDLRASTSSWLAQRFLDAPAHPNYRERFQRMGDAPV